MPHTNGVAPAAGGLALWAGDGLSAATTRLCRALRRRGITVTPAESIDAARVLGCVDLADRGEVRFALRSVLVSRKEDFPTFDEEFDRAFAAPADTQSLGGLLRPRPRAARRPDADAEARGTVSLERWLRPDEDAGDADADENAVSVPRQSDREALGRKDFSSFGDDELDAISRLARAIARRLARRPSRRWRAAARGARIDLRRTMRRSLRTGGEPVELAFRARTPRRTSLVALCDVSGSMDLYSRFLLQVLYALQHAFARVETFVFATRLARITDPLGGEDYRGALERLERDVTGWSGGTRIGAALAEFVRDWPRLVDRRTVVLVLSDGWDTGEPEVLGEAMRVIHRQAGRVIWLNPLLGGAGYEPLTRGMQAALPHVDVFAPAHNLDSLRALATHLAL